MKKRSIAIVSMAVFMGLASSIWAAPHRVMYTVHNLSVTGPGTFKGLESEVCVFCHTPHNAASKKFLWNRVDSLADSQFALYTASPTINFNKSGLVISPVSKMCMTCHDGGTAVNSMANGRTAAWNPGVANEIGDIYYDPFGIGDWGANIGEGSGGDGVPATDVTPRGNLTNDHPISFLYSQSRAGDTSINAETGNDIGGLPLWEGKVECVTCHDPHINYDGLNGGDPKLRPFLRRSNASSNLCFTCHNK